jgi:TRAP-type transport system small permease protein
MSEQLETDGANAWESRLRQPSLWHYLVVAPSWLAAAALFIMMIMTFSDVLLRSTINNPIEWATELTRVFMVIIVFTSLPVISWRGTHIIVDLMDPFFSHMMARLRDITIDLVSGVILLWPAWRIFVQAERFRSYGEVTEYMGWPQHLTSWFIAAFTLITALTLIARGLARIFAPQRIKF